VSRYLGFTAGFLAALGVVLGAFGAHGLKADLHALDSVSTWETASFYHLIHALGALVVHLLNRENPRPAYAWAGSCLVVGIVFFSGSLYWLSLGGPGWLGPVTPVGGTLFIVAWCLVAGALWPSKRSEP
jgi:uncharacterized membrane protein YgdD (TMEM256/DUF423 family)